MDWTAAIEKNHAALRRVLAALVAMTGLDAWLCPRPEGAAMRQPAHAGEDKPAPTISPLLRRAALALLRPAEAAARRLVIVMARGLVVPPVRVRSDACRTRRDAGAVNAATAPRSRARPPSLPLFDPLRLPRRRRTSAVGVPRLCVPGITAPFPIRVRRPDEPVSASGLVRRLEALKRVLDDPGAQAMRLARWRVRVAAARAAARETGAAQGGRCRQTIRFRRLSPLRPGRPPGWRRKPAHEVHDLLDVLHGLAFWSLEPADSS